MPGPLLAIDGPFVLYRSFFALPDSIKGVDQHPVNALLGAANVVLRIAADQEPRAIVMCFGAEAAAYRVELYPDYHAEPAAGPGRAPVAVRPGRRILRCLRLELMRPATGWRPMICSDRWGRSRRTPGARRCC